MRIRKAATKTPKQTISKPRVKKSASLANIAPAIDTNVKINESVNALANPSTYKKGGTVKKTGMALVHKGEKVLTKAQQKKSCKGK